MLSLWGHIYFSFGISLSICDPVSELLCDAVLVISLSILLLIISPVASAVFLIAIFESVADC